VLDKCRGLWSAHRTKRKNQVLRPKDNKYLEDKMNCVAAGGDSVIKARSES